MDRHGPQPLRGQLRCAFCHDSFGVTDPRSACSGCGTLLHPACLEEVATCTVLGCGVLLGTAERGARSPTELYTAALNQSMGSSVRWSIRVCVVGAVLVTLPAAWSSGDGVEAFALLFMSGLVGCLVGALVGGLIGSVGERDLFDGDWISELDDPPE